MNDKYKSMGENEYRCEGRLVRDAEVKYLDGGKAVCKFTIATVTAFKTTERPEEVIFWTVKAWGPLAEFCGTLTKGRQVYVKAAIKEERWIGRDKTEKKEKILNAFSVRRLTWDDDTTQAPNASPQAIGAAQSASAPAFGDDDIPF